MRKEMSVITNRESRESGAKPKRGGPSRVIKRAERFVTRLGAHITHIVLFSARRLHLRFTGLTRLMTSRIVPRLAAFGGYLRSHTIDAASLKLRRTKRYFAELSHDAAQIKASKGGLIAAAVVPVKLGRDAWGKRKVLVSVFNYAAPVCAVAFLVGVINFVAKTDYAVGVKLNGEPVGFVSSETDFEEAKLVVQERINYNGEEIEIVPEMEITPLPEQTEIVGGEELADIILSDVIGEAVEQPLITGTPMDEDPVAIAAVLPAEEEQQLVEAHPVYIDGRFVGAVADVTPIQTALDGLMAPYRMDGEILEMRFSRDISFNETGLYAPETIADGRSIAELITGQEIVPAYYTVVDGDCPIIIAEKNGMTLEDLIALNPTIENECFIGQQVVLQRAKSYVSVECTKRESYSTVLDYEIERVEDNGQYKGIETVKQKGVEGEADVVANVVYVDGYEISRSVVSQNVIKQPVNKIISYGTMIPSPSVASGYGKGGIFQWPVAGGYISDYFGSNRHHKGIDIAAPYGTLIFAAESGTVTRSGNKGDGYGICVMINNGNGYSTVYGHMSKSAVSYGQTVNKGDIIGYVGSTGDSTGNHLHFEVRYNGVYQNPMKFVSK